MEVSSWAPKGFWFIARGFTPWWPGNRDEDSPFRPEGGGGLWSGGAPLVYVPPEGEPEGFYALWRRAPAMNLRPVDPDICRAAGQHMVRIRLPKHMSDRNFWGESRRSDIYLEGRGGILILGPFHQGVNPLAINLRPFGASQCPPDGQTSNLFPAHSELAA